MRRLRWKQLFAALLAAALLLTPAEAVGLGHVTASSGLRLRSEASTSSQVLCIVPKGAEVTALKLHDGWYTVRYQDTVGYMDAEYLDVAQSGTYASPIIGSITGSVVNLRTQPNTEADVVATLAVNTQVTIIGIEQSWYVANYGSLAGYLHPAYVELTDAKPVEPLQVVAPATGAGPDIVIIDPAAQPVDEPVLPAGEPEAPAVETPAVETPAEETPAEEAPAAEVQA